MTILQGYDGMFALRGAARPGQPAGPVEAAGDDLTAVQAAVRDRLTQPGRGPIDILAWSFELNDWVRLETLGQGTDLGSPVRQAPRGVGG